jgi:hypothetical protein
MTTHGRKRYTRVNQPAVYTPGLEEHMTKTGERPPENTWRQPADMVAHGGYAVFQEGKPVAGPFAWYENAERAMGRFAGATVKRAKRP